MEPGTSEHPGVSARCGVLSLADPSLFEIAVRPWELLCQPAQRGQFGYTMAYVSTPRVTFYRETYACGVQLSGIAPTGMLAFAVPLRLQPDTAFWGAPLTGPGFPSTLPGDLDVRMAAGQEHIVVLISMDLLRQELTSEVTERVESAAMNRLLPTTERAAASFGNWLNGRITALSQAPQILSTAAAQASLEHELVHRLAASLALALDEGSPPRLSLRRRCLDRALGYLYENPSLRPSMPELATVAGASQRTLEYAFRGAFGMSPLEFLQLGRLHAVRRALISADPTTGVTVAETASRHGFYELGRFAGMYRRRFGELPSTTLAAQPV